MRTLISSLIFAGAVIGLAGTSAAEERRIALLIGNEAYPAAVGRLDNPHEDVDLMAVSLTSARFAPDDIIVVKDGSQQSMLEGVAEFAARLSAADGDGVGFFYYSGHGASSESGGQRENYLLPSDAEITTAEQLPIFGVPLTSVIKSLSSIESQGVFIISDACRNTLPIASSTKSVGGSGDKGFSPVPMRPGLFIAYATADGATAPDDGAFASAIAGQIAAPNQRASRAFELAFRDVAATRPGTALPFVSPGLTKDFCFVSCPDEAPVPTKGPGDASSEELAAWRAALQEDTREGYTAFSEAYPDTFLGGEAGAMAVLRPTREERAAAKQVAGGNAGDAAIDRTLNALEELTASLEGLARLGGVIDAPESITDFYNNAQVYERRGDTLNARKMYERAIVSGAETVDIHYAYVATLKAQEGLIGAREIYADLARSSPGNRTVQLTHATVLPGDARSAKLNELAQTAPDYGPVYFELARLYSLDRLGAQTLADKQAEEQWLAAFREGDGGGDLEKWFLEKDLLSDWRSDVERRWAAYAAAPDISPVTFSASSSNGGWIITASPTEAATEIFYKAAEMPDFRPTGFMDMTDQRTGKPMAQQFFNLPLGAEAQTLEVKYVNLAGQTQGPFQYEFDPSIRFVENSRMILNMTRTSWVSGRDFDGRGLIYFTHLLTHACGLEKIEYAYGGGEPDSEWPLPACDPLNPGAITDDSQIYDEIDERPESIAIRLTFKDGTQSEIETIPLRY